MLAVAHQGVAFPVLWVLLPKRGNSNTAERIDLVAQLLKLFDRQQIAYLTADREFVGRAWIKYLLKQPVPFRIRIRQSDRLSNGRGKAIKARVLFADLAPEQMRVLPKRRRLWGYWVYVAALRLNDGQNCWLSSHLTLPKLLLQIMPSVGTLKRFSVASSAEASAWNQPICMMRSASANS